jgi:transcription termination/antitermination protein NusG
MWDMLPDRAWLAVHVQSNSERSVYAGLKERNYEAFLPVFSRVTANRSVREKPLFPGYLFFRWQRSYAHRIVEIPGVIRLLGFGRRPVPVDEAEIASVKRVVESGLPSKPWKSLGTGDHVTLIGGPLRGLDGFLMQVSKSTYLIVQITLMRRAIAVKVEPAHVAPAATLIPRGWDGTSSLKTANLLSDAESERRGRRLYSKPLRPSSNGLLLSD